MDSSKLLFAKQNVYWLFNNQMASYSSIYEIQLTAVLFEKTTKIAYQN